MPRLTEKQHAKLDRIDKEDPYAKVVGWMDVKTFAIGPIIEYSDPDRDDVVINLNGYPRKL